MEHFLIINESPNQSVEQTDWTFTVFREGCGRGCLPQRLDFPWQSSIDKHIMD